MHQSPRGESRVASRRRRRRRHNNSETRSIDRSTTADERGWLVYRLHQASKQASKQTNKQTNKQSDKHHNSKEDSGVSDRSIRWEMRSSSTRPAVIEPSFVHSQMHRPSSFLACPLSLHVCLSCHRVSSGSDFRIEKNKSRSGGAAQWRQVWVLFYFIFSFSLSLSLSLSQKNAMRDELVFCL